MAERIDRLDAPSWYLQPGDKLVETLVGMLKAEKVFAKIFGESIYGYKRMDIGVREMPALRVYNDNGRKEAETWYLNGDVKLDVIFPASVRRQDLQRYTDLVTSSLLAWFRAQPTFRAAAEKVPGLNQLGWFFTYDKSLGFKPGDDVDTCPLTQVTVNFRVLLDEWDRYMESDDRERDTPFEKTLGDLETLTFAIQGQNDAGATEVTVTAEVKPTEE